MALPNRQQQKSSMMQKLKDLQQMAQYRQAQKQQQRNKSIKTAKNTWNEANKLSDGKLNQNVNNAYHNATNKMGNYIDAARYNPNNFAGTTGVNGSTVANATNSVAPSATSSLPSSIGAGTAGTTGLAGAEGLGAGTSALGTSSALGAGAGAGSAAGGSALTGAIGAEVAGAGAGSAAGAGGALASGIGAAAPGAAITGAGTGAGAAAGAGAAGGLGSLAGALGPVGAALAVGYQIYNMVKSAKDKKNQEALKIADKEMQDAKQKQAENKQMFSNNDNLQQLAQETGMQLGQQNQYQLPGQQEEPQQSQEQTTPGLFADSTPLAKPMNDVVGELPINTDYLTQSTGGAVGAGLDNLMGTNGMMEDTMNAASPNSQNMLGFNKTDSRGELINGDSAKDRMMDRVMSGNPTETREMVDSHVNEEPNKQRLFDRFRGAPTGGAAALPSIEEMPEPGTQLQDLKLDGYKVEDANDIGQPLQEQFRGNNKTDLEKSTEYIMGSDDEQPVNNKQVETTNEAETLSKESLKDRILKGIGNAARDVYNGYQDNSNTGFKEGDLWKNVTGGASQVDGEVKAEDGTPLEASAEQKKKSLMNRVGEAVGTARRIAANPLAQGLAVTAINRYNGEDWRDSLSNGFDYGKAKAKSDYYNKIMNPGRSSGIFDSFDAKDYNAQVDARNKDANTEINRYKANTDAAYKQWQQENGNKKTDAQIKHWDNQDKVADFKAKTDSAYKSGMLGVAKTNAATNSFKAKAQAGHWKIQDSKTASQVQFNDDLSYYAELLSNPKATSDSKQKARNFLIKNYGPDFLKIEDKIFDEDDED